MRSRLLWAGVLVCLATAASLAQDPVKPGVDLVAFTAGQKMLAGHVVKRRILGEHILPVAHPVIGHSTR